MDDMLLEKIDLIRERMNVTYKEARQALEEAGGSVVEALVLIENRRIDSQAARRAEAEKRRSEFAVRGNELVEKVKAVVRQGNATTLRVLHKSEVLFELPLTAGAATVLLIPQLALLAGIAVMFAQVTIQLDYPAGSSDCDCGCGCSEAKPCTTSQTAEPCECGCGCTEPIEEPEQPETLEPESFSWTAPDAEPEEEPKA